MTVTPRPWRDAQTMGAIVSDDPDAIEARGPENLKGYGGAIVCESAEKPDREFIIRAANEYDAHVAIEEAMRRCIFYNLPENEPPEGDSWHKAWTDAGEAIGRLYALRGGS